ncbi:MAG: hypothetical protein LUE93_06065 [Bacteroides sp.]|nr:hypothetical protein [Bacteroides sp.]
MKEFKISEPETFFDLTTGKLHSEQALCSRKEIKDLAGVFKEEEERKKWFRISLYMK